MRLDIVPKKSVGPLRFGMTRAEVAAALGLSPERFRRDPSDASDEDSFDSLSLFARYDESDRLREVELGSPGDAFVGAFSLGCPYAQLLAWARGLDPALEESALADGFVASALGLSTYTSKPKSLWASEPADSVSFSAP